MIVTNHSGQFLGDAIHDPLDTAMMPAPKF
jgi:hypothetical protein